jgi:hypothetical protein
MAREAVCPDYNICADYCWCVLVWGYFLFHDLQMCRHQQQPLRASMYNFYAKWKSKHFFMIVNKKRICNWTENKISICEVLVYMYEVSVFMETLLLNFYFGILHPVAHTLSRLLKQQQLLMCLFIFIGIHNYFRKVTSLQRIRCFVL